MADKPQSSAEEILVGLDGAIDEMEIFHNQILVAIWIRSGTTKGGVILTDKTLAEDQYQGKVGLVLKKGPSVFENDARNDFKGQNVEIGDWVLFRIQDAISIDINKIHCRMIEDIFIRARIPSPELIW